MTPTPSPVSGIASNWFAGDGAATIFAAAIGALVVVAGYFIQQSFVRKERRAQVYSEAIRAVEDYLEAPFLILRRDKTVSTQRQLTAYISDIQSRIAYHRAQLAIDASEPIASAYAELVDAARLEAGKAMTDAWKTRHGRQVPLGERYARVRSDEALAELVKRMRADVA